jgi:hypothetical protein
MLAKFLNAAKNAKTTSVAIVAMELSGAASLISFWVLLRAHGNADAATSSYHASGEDSQVLFFYAMISMVLAITAMVLSFWVTHRVRERHGLVAFDHARELASPATLLLGGWQVLRGSVSVVSLRSLLLIGF